jgi:hypothetical protein
VNSLLAGNISRSLDDLSRSVQSIDLWVHNVCSGIHQGESWRHLITSSGFDGRVRYTPSSVAW